MKLQRHGPVRPILGRSRAFVEDSDKVILRAHAKRAGFVSIGFGECCGRIVA